MECFAVFADEIENRMDPFYYKKDFKEFDERIQNKGLKFTRIDEISKVFCGPFGSSITVKDYKTEGVPLIRISNIKDGHLSKEDLVFISKEKSEKLKSYVVKKGDIIISQRGTLGLSVQIDDSFDGAIISANFIAIKDIVGISSDFLQIILSSELGQMQLLRKTSGQVQIKITTDDIKTIQIPIISEKKEKEIIKLVRSGYKQKSKKESEANKLLHSINDHILDELGINLNITERKIFTLNSKNVQGRLDPLFYSVDIYDFLRQSKYDIVIIDEVIDQLKTGFAAGKGMQKLEQTGIIQIRPTNISREGRLIFTKNVFLNEEQKEIKPGDLILKGEILFNNTNSQELVGKSTYFDIEGDFCCSNHITRIQTKSDRVNSAYLTQLFNLYQRKKIFYKICTNWNNQSGVNNDLLKTLQIPLPSLTIQNKIAKEVKKRMQKAEQLQREAKEEWDKAMQEVENIILGENK